MDAIQSKQKLLSILVLSLALASCGGGSGSFETTELDGADKTPEQGGSGNTTLLGAGVDYTGEASAAMALPAEGDTENFVQAVVQVLKLKNIPAFRADDLSKKLSKNKQVCQTGSTVYTSNTNAGTGLLKSSEASFDECAVQVSSGILPESKILNGELSYSMETNLYSQTDSYVFKEVSVVNTWGVNEAVVSSYLLNGSYDLEFKSINGVVQPSASWSMEATYGYPSNTTAFKSKGTLKHQNTLVGNSEAEDDDDEVVTLSVFDSSFTLNEVTYKLEYSTSNIYSYNTVYESMKFYDPEMGYYHLDISSLNGKSCSKNGVMYSGFAGTVMIKDHTDANLLSVTVDCEAVTYQ